jgi:hypothetical protein
MAATSINLEKLGWMINADYADASGAEVLKVAPATSGESHYIEYISINSDSAINITVGAGETGSAVDTEIVGPIEFTTSGGQYDTHFTRPVKVDADTLIAVDSSGAGQLSVIVYGYTK